MAEVEVFLEDTPVLRVRADWKAGGPPAAFNRLESNLPTLKGRKFYGIFKASPEGEEYFACVARIESDDPEAMHLEEGLIPGGWYARRKLLNWEEDVSKIGKTFDEMANKCKVDGERQSIEFYRSQIEVLLYLPIQRLGSSSTPAR